jgi:hypothetical protein
VPEHNVTGCEPQDESRRSEAARIVIPTRAEVRSATCEVEGYAVNRTLANPIVSDKRANPMERIETMVLSRRNLADLPTR